MTVTLLGIKLILLQNEHLEMVRKWRNSPTVRNAMQYRSTITAEAQREWFATIQNPENAYFIAYQDKTPFGVVNLKDINVQKKKAEAGVFVGHPDYRNHPVAFRVVIAISDLAFALYKIEKLMAVIGKDNQRALQMNQSIGYRYSGEKDPNFAHYALTKTDYLEATKKLRPHLQKLYGGTIKIKNLPSYWQFNEPEETGFSVVELK